MKCTRILNNSETHIYLDTSFSFSSFKMWKSWHFEWWWCIDPSFQGAASKIWTATYLWGIIVCVCIIGGPLAWRSQDRKNWMLKTVSCSLSLLLMLLFLVFGVIFSTFTLSWTISCLNPLFCHLYVQHHHCTLLFFLRGPHGNTSLSVAYEQPSTLWSQIPVQIQPQYHHLILPITADTTVLSQDESNNLFTLSLVWLLDKLCFTLLFG